MLIGGMTMKLFVKYISIVLAIYLLSLVLNTIYIGSFGSLLIMGMVLLLVNLILKPILMLITLPVNLLTLGLFSFVVNAWTIMIADYFVENISMGGFMNSLLAAFIIAILNNLLKDKD
jgi:putative membrane protein